MKFAVYLSPIHLLLPRTDAAKLMSSKSISNFFLIAQVATKNYDYEVHRHVLETNYQIQCSYFHYQFDKSIFQQFLLTKVLSK